MENAELVMDFRISDKKALDRQLNTAVETAIQRALPQRKGVLVTRHDGSRFTITVTTEVPFGLIYEHDRSERPSGKTGASNWPGRLNRTEQALRWPSPPS